MGGGGGGDCEREIVIVIVCVCGGGGGEVGRDGEISKVILTAPVRRRTACPLHLDQYLCNLGLTFSRYSWRPAHGTAVRVYVCVWMFCPYFDVLLNVLYALIANGVVAQI